MPSEAEIEKKFWKALKSDRTVMLGLDDVERAHPRPMAAQFDEDRAPLWFFTSNHSELVRALGPGSRAIATFAAKDHTLFATLHGTLSLDNRREIIDRFDSDGHDDNEDVQNDVPKGFMLDGNIHSLNIEALFHDFEVTGLTKK